jgi:aryl-alcohol dehydrogenase
MKFLQEGRVVRGVIQGDGTPKDFIPRLVDLIMDNKFPIQKMIKFYDFADINLAAEESSAGIAIKPVLRMPQ